MTGLRDARLQRALDHAPDAHLRPDAPVRAAVLRAAHEAVVRAPAAAPATGWWARWRGAGNGAGRSRMPWNAAFATVLVAGIATLLWHGQEVPDARLDQPAAAVSPGQVAPPPSASPVPIAPRAPGAREAADSGPRNRGALVKRAEVPVAKPADKAAPVRDAEPAPRTEDLAKARQRADAPALAPAPAQAPQAPPVVAQGPAAAPPAAPAPSTAKAEAGLQPGADAFDAFTELRVLANARSASVGREQAQALPGLMRALTVPIPAPRRAAGNLARKESADAATSASAGMAAEQSAGLGASASAVQEPPLRIELRRGNEVSGTLEITGGRWRLQGADGTVRSGPADAAALQALRAELARLGLM